MHGISMDQMRRGLLSKSPEVPVLGMNHRAQKNILEGFTGKGRGFDLFSSHLVFLIETK